VSTGVVAPVTGFTANVTSGTSPLAIGFTDSSSNTPTNWDWYWFANETKSSDLQNPTTILTTGLYNVRLYTSNSAGGDWENKTAYITVSTGVVAPVTGFTANVTSGTSPLAIGFTDSSSNTPTNWDWYWFANETKSSDLQNPTTILTTGLYNVRLYTSNSAGGDWENKTSYINVRNSTSGVTRFYATGAGNYKMSTSTSNLSWADLMNSSANLRNNESPEYAYINYATHTSTTDHYQGFSRMYWTADTSSLAGKTITGANFSGTRSGPVTEGILNPFYLYVGKARPITQGTWVYADARNVTRGAGLSMSQPVSSDSFAIDENIDGDASGLRHNWVITNLSLINATGWTSLYVSTGADVLNSGAPCIPWQPYIYDQVKMNLSGTTITQDYKPYLDVYWTEGGGGSAPVTAFAANVTTGTEPLVVGFTDASTNTPTNWDWYWFANETKSSVVQNPTTTLTTGTYSVRLYTSNSAGGDWENKTAYITVSSGVGAPVTGFSANVTSGSTPLAVRFTDSSTNAPTNWDWYWYPNETKSSVVQNPTATLTTGTYSVRLYTSNSAGGDWENKTAYITVSSGVVAPVTGFAANVTSGTAPLAVGFTDASTNTPTNWDWYFGNGTKFSDAQNPSVTLAGGTYTVSLYTSNAYGGDWENKTDYITVSTPAPVASFTSDKTTGTVPLNVSFTDASTGEITSYLWNFGDTASSTLKNPSHLYTTVGTYTVNLTVTGPGGSATRTQTNYITVRDALPVAAFSGTPTTGTVPLNVSFSDASTGVITSYLWNFGDTTTSTLKNPSHNYTAAGTYTVKLTVSNSGGSNTITKRNYITVTLPVLKADFTANKTSGQNPLAVQFTDSSSGPITSYVWNFGDGGSSVERNPVHIYTKAGRYTVKLTVSNSASSNTVTKKYYITVT
jgi:PKD repeat protein